MKSTRLSSPSHLKLLRFTAISKAHTQAERSLEELNQILQQIPYRSCLLSILQFKEAQASLRSQKVFIPLTDLLFYHHLSEQKKEISLLPRQILNYQKVLTMAASYRKKKSLSISLLEKFHKIMEKDSAQLPIDKGHIRLRQNWIGPIGCNQSEAHYLPPPPSKVKDHLEKWIRSFNDPKQTDLLQLSKLYGEFLAIHPFMDANGRIARSLIPLFSYWKERLPSPLLFLSSSFLKTRSSYFDALHLLSCKHRWDKWILYFLKTAEEGIQKLKKESKKILAIYRRTLISLDPLQIPRKKIALVRFLFSFPIFNQKLLEEKLSYSPLHAKKIISFLKRRKLIQSIKSDVDNVLVFVPLMGRIKKELKEKKG